MSQYTDSGLNKTYNHLRWETEAMYLSKPAILFSCFFILCFQPVMAEDAITLRGPEEISQEEWVEINNHIYDHQLCLKDEIVKSLQVAENARDVSNHILEICSPHLLGLKQKMQSWNIAPSFIDQYIYAKKNKSANKMLRAVMMLMANKQASEEPENLETTE